LLFVATVEEEVEEMEAVEAEMLVVVEEVVQVKYLI
jgi:hypothetical protein